MEINRSHIMREALTHWLDHIVKRSDFSGVGLSIISYIYDHHESTVVSQLNKVRHDFEEIINSSINVHLEHHKKFEVNICKGNFDELKSLASSIRRIKGITAFTENYYQ